MLCSAKINVRFVSPLCPKEYPYRTLTKLRIQAFVHHIYHDIRSIKIAHGAAEAESLRKQISDFASILKS